MPVFPLQNDTFLWYNEAILREGGKCMAREYDLYLKTAVFEKCRKDKEKVKMLWKKKVKVMIRDHRQLSQSPRHIFTAVFSRVEMM